MALALPVLLDILKHLSRLKSGGSFFGFITARRLPKSILALNVSSVRMQNKGQPVYHSSGALPCPFLRNGHILRPSCGLHVAYAAHVQSDGGGNGDCEGCKIHPASVARGWARGFEELESASTTIKRAAGSSQIRTDYRFTMMPPRARLACASTASDRSCIELHSIEEIRWRLDGENLVRLAHHFRS